MSGNVLSKWHGDFFLALFLAGLAGAIGALLVGLPALRIKGLFLAVTVLAATPTNFTYALATNPGTANVTGAKSNNGKLDEILNGYFAPREQILTILDTSLEFRTKKYTEYYAKFLSVGSTPRLCA